MFIQYIIICEKLLSLNTIYEVGIDIEAFISGLVLIAFWKRALHRISQNLACDHQSHAVNLLIIHDHDDQDVTYSIHELQHF